MYNMQPRFRSYIELRGIFLYHEKVQVKERDYIGVKDTQVARNGIYIEFPEIISTITTLYM